MIYKNRETGEYTTDPIGAELSKCDEVELVDKDGNFNIDYLDSIIPTGELTHIEMHQLIFGFLNIPYIHIKTDNLYFLNNIAIECTNGQEDKIKCIYRNKYGVMFTRDLKEFFQKFKRIV